VVYKGQIVPNNSQGHTDPDDDDAIAFGMTGEERVVLYFTNCSKAYLNSQYDFASDLAAFGNNCEGYKVGFYYTPREWFPGEEPYEVGEDISGTETGDSGAVEKAHVFVSVITTLCGLSENLFSVR
jgi:hypothetical protein